uniref:Uncharacterized protein n=1 Tax=Rhizophora mucronata TaxID=61149 RepID=A0A2P2PFR5_RHIMU
MIAAATANNFK